MVSTSQPTDFLAMRHYVPLGVAYSSLLGFSACEIAPGLEIRECSDSDKQLLEKVSRESSDVIALMQTVPMPASPYIMCIDEMIYGRYVESNIKAELDRPTKPFNRN